MTALEILNSLKWTVLTRDPQNLFLNLPIILSGNSFFHHLLFPKLFPKLFPEIIPEYLHHITSATIEAVISKH